MGRSLDEIIAEMPPERQVDVEARYQVLKQEVEGLRELRLIAGKAQADIATARNYVSSALDEALAGKAVTVSSSAPYGCSVKY